MGNTWIWTTGQPSRNTFARFRKEFTPATSGRMILRISADSRYWVFLNGVRIGFGPVRSWPKHWKYDEYDISAQLNPSKNVLAVLVNHLGEGNFQYIPADPGLWVEVLETRGRSKAKPLFRADETWKVNSAPAYISAVPRIAVQEGFEEQHDARLDDDWTLAGYDDSQWQQAVVVRAPHPTPKPSGIPLLTAEPVFPRRVLRAERIHRPRTTWTLNTKPSYAPEDISSNMAFVRGFLFTQVWSRVNQTATFLRPHHHSSLFFVNGVEIPAVYGEMTQASHCQKISLRKGWNAVLIPYPSLEGSDDGIKPTGAVHLAQFVLAISSPHALEWSARGEEGGSPWAFIGPFAFTAEEERNIQTHIDYPRIVRSTMIHPEATTDLFARVLKAGKIEPAVINAPFFRDIKDDDILTNDVAAMAFADEVVGPATLHYPDALLSDNAAWSTLEISADGADLRFLVDFGREVVGHQLFEVDASEGTILDFHNFEFIQPDGRENYADGMNNSFRYICRDGLQSFRTLQRRGFQYTWVIVRQASGLVRFRTVHMEFSSYPQARRGSFASSDALLNQIWEIGAHTIRCCAEDTYTDCPSYEQTHWVGDARNEALADWVINGDSRLWFRCIEQAAQSLERAPITLSQVPSAWDNILPAWSFLWMRSCREYLLWTGDRDGAEKLHPWISRNVDGIEKHLNAQGLFEMQGWNMFDWAQMDTPAQGVITHLNCFAVLALKDCAELASWLGEKASARRFDKLAASISKAINRHLWSEGESAYVDCIHADGRVSSVFSQQTQTVALIAGVAQSERADRCRQLVHRSPKHFVKAGSPFFEFFLLEVLAQEGRAKDFLDMIRRDWGFMVEQGATTFWEMWSLKTGRLTRSHCHGWSAAPTFFLSNIILGIHPTKPGFQEIRFNPQLGDLRFIRGCMPTPHGLIQVECQKNGAAIQATLTVPRGIKISRDSAPHTLYKS